MHSDKIFILVNNKRTSLAEFALMERSSIKTVYARGCTGLTELSAPEAKTVDATGCTGLTELSAPKAEYVYARGCTGLTELSAPEAKTVYASGCTGLTELKADAATKINRDLHYVAGGVDSRGYYFEGVEIRGQKRVLAGCRNYSLSEAREHWGPCGESDRPDCLALVEKIAIEFAKWGEVEPRPAFRFPFSASSLVRLLSTSMGGCGDEHRSK